MRSQMVRRFCFILGCLLGAFLLVGCNARNAQEQPMPTPQSTNMAQGTEDAHTAASVAQSLIGFVVPSGNDISLCTLKHGFLRTAENLGYPAKLYTASTGNTAVVAVELAAQEGCTGILIYNKDNANTAAIARAKELGLPVIVPYYETDDQNVDANVFADMSGYTEEVALGVAERMVERECKAGKILVYGRSPEETSAKFREAIVTYYPQFNVDYFTRTALTQDAAIDELALYILWNRDIKGMFCPDADGALVMVRAREKADSEFKKNGAPDAPKASPNSNSTPSVSYAATPGPTPVPSGLIKSIIISAAGYSMNDDTISLINKNDIYAFVIEPYYEAAAQSVMLLDRLLSGESVPTRYRLNMPIVRNSTLEKYVLINQQVKDWFDLN